MASKKPERCPQCGCAEHYFVDEGPTADGEGIGEWRSCEHCDGDEPHRPSCPEDRRTWPAWAGYDEDGDFLLVVRNTPGKWPAEEEDAVAFLWGIEDRIRAKALAEARKQHELDTKELREQVTDAVREKELTLVRWREAERQMDHARIETGCASPFPDSGPGGNPTRGTARGGARPGIDRTESTKR